MESHENFRNSDEDDDVRSTDSNDLINYHPMFQDSGAAKKASLDDLSREELVTKCKNLLKLAQQAKSAKDGMCSRK